MVCVRYRPRQLRAARFGPASPLKDAKKILLSADSTSFNTGYQLDLAKTNQGRQDKPPLNEPAREF